MCSRCREDKEKEKKMKKMDRGQKKLLRRVLEILGLKLDRSEKFAERSWSCGNLGAETPDEVKTLRCLLAKRGRRGSGDDSPVRFQRADFGDLSFRVYGAATHFEDEEELAETLLACKELMWCPADALGDLERLEAETESWKNPVCGCKSLEEAVVKLNLLREDGNDDGGEEEEEQEV